MKHIMVDIETLSTAVNAAVLSIKSELLSHVEGMYNVKAVSF